MDRQRIVATAALLLLGGLGGAFIVEGLGCRRTEFLRPSVPTFHCPSPEKNVGDVWATDELRVLFPLVNNSSEQSFDVELRASCRCAKITPRRLRLSPLQNVDVAVVVDLQRPAQNPSPDGAFSEGVFVRARRGDGTELVSKLNIRGRMHPSYVISPTSLDFGRVIWGKGARRECRISCVAPCAVGPLGILSTPDGVEVTVSPSAADPSTWLLSARACGRAYGQLQGSIRLSAVFPSGVVVTRSVPVKGWVEDDLHSLPSSLFFGGPILSPGGQCVTLSS